MKWLLKLFGAGAATASGVSPMVFAVVFLVGMGVGGAIAAGLQQIRINGLKTAVASWETLVKGDFGLMTQIDALKAATGDRDAEIRRLNAELDKITADAQATQAATVALMNEAEARATETERKLSELRKKANAAIDSEKPKPLSPTARAAYDWGMCKTRAAISNGDPAACQ